MAAIKLAVILLSASSIGTNDHTRSEVLRKLEVKRWTGVEFASKQSDSRVTVVC